MIIKNLPQVILASSSPSRKMLLERLQIPFQSLSPDVDETPLPGESAKQLVKRLANTKAHVFVDQFPSSLIIGCDQVGVLDDEIICKPLTHANAVAQLQKMSGRKIRFFTAICLIDTRNHHIQESTEIYDVYFRDICVDEIEEYLLKEESYHCAGSLHVEGLGISLLEKLDGADYTALIGLPLIRLVTMLRAISH